MTCCTPTEACQPFTHPGGDITHDEARKAAARYGGDVFIDRAGRPVAHYPPVSHFDVTTFAGAVRWVWEQHHPYLLRVQLGATMIACRRLTADTATWPDYWDELDHDVVDVLGCSAC